MLPPMLPGEDAVAIQKAGQASEAAPSSELESCDNDGSPWVLRLGNYLSGQATPSDDERPWAVRLGSYLNERKPGPWSLIANEKPQDPLALRLGTFLNETKPIGLLHRRKDGGAEDADDPETLASSSEPLVLRLGNYLQARSAASSPSTMAAANAQAAPSPVDGSLAPSRTAAEPATAGDSVVTAVESGEADGTVGAAGLAWTRGGIEKPDGEKDMGGWIAAVYTEEQQERLGVTKDGTPHVVAQATEPATDASEPTTP